MSGGFVESDLHETEIVLTGGHLRSPVLLSGLLIINEKRFFNVQKWIPGFCLYLTGQNPNQSPLARARIFETMRGRLRDTCAKLMQQLRDVLAGGPKGATKVKADALMRSVCDDVAGRDVVTRKRRSHKRPSCKGLLPKYGTVEMNEGTPPWSPTCLLTTEGGNVAMEVTTENFKALFDIVQGQIDKPGEGSAAPHTPTRTLRRRRSNPLYKQESPNGTKYNVTGKGWLRCVKEEVATPGCSSGSTVKKRRKFTKVAGSPCGKLARASKAAAEAREEAPPMSAGRILEADETSSCDPFGARSSSDDE